MRQDPQTWNSVKTLVADALELPADEREPFLKRKCDGSETLFLEVKALVSSYEHTDGVIDSRTDAWLGLGGPDLLALRGHRIGRYVLDRLLAEGAMAAVYVARQSNPDRDVAIKLVRTSLPLIDASHRFKREADALGRLQHPNIARIYEAGIHRDGKGTTMPFIAMEYVNGTPLTQHARDAKLSRSDRIRLMIKVADAVHAAHQQAVIHRDLKPANVLVDQTGEPKVLDFGIARIIGADDENFTWQTTAGVLLGTPGYMSPEQAGGNVNAIDVRSDVWSLGVLLHELLTDRLPIEVRNTSVVEVLKRIETAEPAPISKFDRTLRGDIETVVGTALTREKERRYASAEAFANDLRHVLSYEPISARPPSTLYRVSKFVRRHRFGAAMTLLTAVLLIGATVATSIGFLQARKQRDIAIASQTRATAVSEFLKQMLSAADTNTGGTRDLTVLQAIHSAESRISSNFSGDPLAEAGVREAIGWTLYSLGEYDTARTHLQRTVEIYRTRLGIEDRATLNAQNYLSIVMRWQYKPDDAEVVLNQALPISRRVFGDTDATTLSLLDNVAGVASDRGKNELAENLYRDLLKLCRESKAADAGPDGELTFTAMNNLANVYIEMARHSDAETLLRDLLERRAKTQGMKTISQITARSNLAISLLGMGRAPEALTILTDLRHDAESVLGPTHDHTLSVLGAQCEALVQSERVPESLVTRKTLVERFTEKYGLEHPSTARSRANLAADLIESGSAAEAVPLARGAFETMERLVSRDHVHTSRAQNIYARALSDTGQTADAERLWTDSLQRLSNKHGVENYDYSVCANNLARMFIATGRSREAIALLTPIVDFADREVSQQLSIAVHRNLGRAHLALKEFEQAEKEFLKVHQADQSRPNDRISVKKTMDCFIELYGAWNKPEQAEQWRARSVSAHSTSPAATQSFER